MHSTLETLRQYEQNSALDRERAYDRGDVTTSEYFHGKYDAYGVAIAMVEELVELLNDAVAWADSK